MGIRFLKMHGLGNDFVIIDARAHPVAINASTARKICDRRRGVGCDQLLLIEPARGAGDASMKIWNPDGSMSGACGNGARCVSQILFEASHRESLRLDTEGGLLNCTRAADGRISIDMGEPKFDWQDIPLAERMDTRILDIKVGPIDAPVLFGPAAVNMGNPHCVFFVPDVNAHDLAKIGPMLEYHPLFPERANISLAQILSRDEIRVRVWERGAGLTLACGSAACAVAVLAARKKLAERKVRVMLDGGALDIEWREASNRVVMTGPTALSFTGEIADALLEDPST